jgi:nitric oxide reductase NorQ protein
VAARRALSSTWRAAQAPAVEAAIVSMEAGIVEDMAAQLVALGVRTRRLQGHGLDEGASTRMLVHAGLLMRQGLAAVEACRSAVVAPLSDEADIVQALKGALSASF